MRLVDALIQIGKHGISAVVEETKHQFKKNREIKFKVAQTLIEGRMKEYTQKLAGELAEKTDSTILSVRGRTFVLRRNKDVDKNTKN